MKNPPCSEWNAWIGKEIEGTRDIGEPTLFIRKEYSLGELISIRKHSPIIYRIWFCATNYAIKGNWDLIVSACSLFNKVCVEVDLSVKEIPAALLQEKAVTIYLKVPFCLRKGDFVCVGSTYADEAFEIGTGTIVSPGQYENDVRLD